MMKIESASLKCGDDLLWIEDRVYEGGYCLAIISSSELSAMVRKELGCPVEIVILDDTAKCVNTLVDRLRAHAATHSDSKDLLLAAAIALGG